MQKKRSFSPYLRNFAPEFRQQRCAVTLLEAVFNFVAPIIAACFQFNLHDFNMSFSLRTLALGSAFTLLTALAPCAFATELAAATPDSATVTPQKSRNLVERLIDYIADANKPPSNKRLDFTVVGGPKYSAATSFELEVMGAALYHARMDSLTPISNSSITLEGSLTGFWAVSLTGDHYGPEDSYRVRYNAEFANFPLKFWGIGYAMESQKANETKYTELRSDVWADFQWRLMENLYLGPSTTFHYAKATKVKRPELWDGEDLSVYDLGVGLGLRFSYDTRDVSTYPSSGVNLNFKQQFYPSWLHNRYAFASSELTAAWFRRLWSTGILATQLHGMATAGHTPWSMLPTLDASQGMRGYYEGRYRDKNEADFVAELRQHVYKRTGIVVWGGVGSVFRRAADIRWNTLLPTYGVGVRWEFKKNVNVRVDFGIGKHSTAVSMGMYETF